MESVTFRRLSTLGVLVLAGCALGRTSYAPQVSAPAFTARLAHANAACPKSFKNGTPLIIHDSSGLPASKLNLYFTATDPKNSSGFVYLNDQGTTTPFAPGNAATAFPIASCFKGSLGTKNEAKFTFPIMSGGRLWIAYGTLKLAGADNNGFSAPVGWVKGQPGYDVVWDTVEFSNNNPGIFVNLTRVDMLGLPLNLKVNPVSKNVKGSFSLIGEDLSKYSTILQSFVNDAPFDQNVITVPSTKAPRIINPSHQPSFPDVFSATKFFAGGYLNKVAGYYGSPPKNITYDTSYKPYCGGSWAASFGSGKFSFKQGGSTHAYPQTLFSTNYIFADNPAPNYGAGSCAFQLDKIFLQELNRGVSMGPTHPNNTAKTFYPKGQIDNQYACILHNYSLQHATYGFAFDDAADQASVIQNTAPASVELTIGKIPAIPKATKPAACVANY